MISLIGDARWQGLTLAGAVLFAANCLIADADRAEAKNRREKWVECGGLDARQASLEQLLFRFSAQEIPVQLDETAAERQAGGEIRVLVVLDNAVPDSFLAHYDFIRTFTVSPAGCMAFSRRSASL